MPSFQDTAISPAAPEEVWKLLYDPARFPDWWEGMETVEDAREEGDGRKSFTFYSEGYPDFPMPQLLSSERDGRRVVVSCQVSDLRYEWRLEPEGEGTRITVLVELPEKEAARLATQREKIGKSLARLAKVAAAAPL